MDEEHNATTIRASKDHDGGGAGKWLLGGLAALVLLGGGYFAWKTYGQDTSQTQTAYNDPYATEPTASAPLDSTQSSGNERADDNAPASSSSRSAASTRRSTTASAQAVPEETIGITPISATTDDQVEQSEEVIVTAPRRPVWSRVPSEQRLVSYYPEHARSVGREGEAQLSCTVLSDGALDCARVSEYPARAGFGAAALQVARGFRHAPTTATGGNAAGSPVNLHVVFRMEDAPRRG